MQYRLADSSFSYVDYLKSDKWLAKRRAVLERDGGICQACLIRAATQIHHKTYKRVGDEALFDLVAVCAPCHEKIHGKAALT
jgi:5-methylcytosine-specific restriction endonuclease McrA